uniref:non-specific serine/threonine protein kinase n=1 Tax=Electrophorus electricus TaxID=8005 RepID=A0A4W4G6J3_ELEEL
SCLATTALKKPEGESLLVDMDSVDPPGSASQACPPPLKRQAVKRHHHKHNLKHRYEFKETLGKGTYGKVKKAVDRSGRMVAIKSIRKENIKDEQDLMHIRREIEIMSSLNHPYIITIYEVFENKDKIVIVMEYASRGDLFEYISERQISERESRHFFRQIVSAVHYCHRINSSVKLVLNANDHKIVIADFGLSNLFRRGEYLQTYCGSPLYASPEIVNGRPYKGPEVDSWSLGVLLYTLVHGTMPFDGLDYKSLVRQISTGDYHKPAKPSDACGLIRWMLMVNPERRATLEEIASHWWLNWGYQQPLLAESKKASGSKMRCLLRPAGSAGGDVAITRQRSIRKSRKENDVSQSMQESAVLRPFKGILKKRGSLKQKLPGEVQAPPLEEKTTNTVGAPPPLPRKGILKKPVERESGYYSSSAESSGPAHTPQHRACPSMLPRQKGILKRHGKFSSSGLQEFGSLDQLAASLPPGSSRSRPRAISEDSILSSESFDRLDLPDRHHPAAMVQHPAGGSTMRGSVSVDNLMDLREDKPTGPRKGYWDIDMDCYQSAVGGSTFSIPDCRDVTKVYNISWNLYKLG